MSASYHPRSNLYAELACAKPYQFTGLRDARVERGDVYQRTNHELHPLVRAEQRDVHQQPADPDESGGDSFQPGSGFDLLFCGDLHCQQRTEQPLQQRGSIHACPSATAADLAAHHHRAVIGKYIGKYLTAEEKRAYIAHEKIARNLTLKAIATELRMEPKTVEYHWAQARKQIRRCGLNQD